MKPADFLNSSEKSQITEAIKQAEKNTSGEVRVHLESHCKSDPLDRAVYIFEKIGMHKTKQRNGVLFYVAFADKKFAILGDVGINAVVPENFWDNIKEGLAHRFSKNDFAGGLSEAIQSAGKQLKKHFPYQTDDVNELSDDISFGKK